MLGKDVHKSLRIYAYSGAVGVAFFGLWMVLPHSPAAEPFQMVAASAAAPIGNATTSIATTATQELEPAPTEPVPAKIPPKKVAVSKPADNPGVTPEVPTTTPPPPLIPPPPGWPPSQFPQPAPTTLPPPPQTTTTTPPPASAPVPVIPPSRPTSSQPTPPLKPTTTPATPKPVVQIPQTSSVMFSDTFANYKDGLITSEFAYWNPSDVSAKKSTQWELTSGSLFAKGGAAWTGAPDSGHAPNNLSSNFNGSGIFRLTTKRADFGNVKVSFDLNLHKLSTGDATPEVAWDGVHIFLRYQSQYHLYYASINRRDDTVVIKKKVPGGPSNGGTYYDLSTFNKYKVPYDKWQKVSATIKNESDGSVSIELFADGKSVAKAKDTGTNGAPITAPGKVGIRADNADLQFKNFTVTAI